LKIRRVVINQRKAQLEVVVANGAVYPLPFSQLSPRPTSANRIREVYPDKELAKEALTCSRPERRARFISTPCWSTTKNLTT